LGKVLVGREFLLDPKFIFYDFGAKNEKAGKWARFGGKSNACRLPKSRMGKYPIEVPNAAHV
jgi:hypothetical protein